MVKELQIVFLYSLNTRFLLAKSGQFDSSIRMVVPGPGLALIPFMSLVTLTAAAHRDFTVIVNTKLFSTKLAAMHQHIISVSILQSNSVQTDFNGATAGFKKGIEFLGDTPSDEATAGFIEEATEAVINAKLLRTVSVMAFQDLRCDI